MLHHNSAGRVNLAFHPNGDWIATACEQDPDIDLWNTHTGNRFASIASHSHSPTSIAFSPNGSYLVSGGQDGSIEIWQVAVDRQPQFIKMLVGHQNNVSVITCSRNNFLASLSYGENIKLWNLESGKLLREIEGHNRLIGANAFSPDGKLLLQGDSSGKIRVWDMLKHCYIASIQGHRGPVWVIAFHPNGKTFSTAGDDRSVRLWDIDSLNCIQTHLGHTSPIFAMTYNQDGSILASGGISRDIFLWDTNPEASSLELNFIETPDDVWSLAFDPGGENLMSGHMNGTAIIWDVKTGKKKVTLQHDENTIPVGAARFSSDGKILITSSNHQLLKFWDVETWECLRTIAIESEGNRTNAVAIGEDARIIATGSTEPVVHLRRFGPDGTLAETFVLAGHANRVWGVALSADERYLASSDEEGTTLISDVQAGRVLEKIMLDRPYERMNVSGVTGLNAAEHAALKALGAIETAQGDPH